MTERSSSKGVAEFPPQDGTDSSRVIMEGRSPAQFAADTLTNVGFVAVEVTKLGFKGLGRGALKVAGIAYAAPSHVRMLAEKTGSGYLKSEYGIPADDTQDGTVER